MLFNSFEYFAIFLPLVYLSFVFSIRLDKPILSKLILALTSLFFYSYWKLGYLPILLVSITVNYTLGRYLKSTDNKTLRQSALGLGVIFNLSLLGYYKYFDFFISNINYLLSEPIPQANLILPLAISFYTFQQIAYLVDTYRNQTKDTSLLNYIIFVSFFPQLIAGPIVHHAKIVPQLNRKTFLSFQADNFTAGLFYLSVGLFKKVVMADSLASIVSAGYDTNVPLLPQEVIFAVVAYSFQLYFDFSGYSDMAIGAARLFNIRLPLNFSSPYQSSNIREFWRRWHMTLNDFMTRYVYGPLRGRHKKLYRSYLAIFVTFFLVGIWHGAGWNFVIFGLMHASGVLFVTVMSGRLDFIPHRIAVLINFIFIAITLVLFRAAGPEKAFSMYQTVFSLTDWLQAVTVFDGTLSSLLGNLKATWWDVWLIGFSIWLIFVCQNSNELVSSPRMRKYRLVFSLSVFILSLLFNTSSNEFIYFNF